MRELSKGTQDSLRMFLRSPRARQTWPGSCGGDLHGPAKSLDGNEDVSPRDADNTETK